MVTTPMSQADVLDTALGDPWDDGNPAGHRATLEADQRGEPFIEGERRLAEFGLNAQLVPRSEGGLFTRADHACELLRTVWRRDPGLALGFLEQRFDIARSLLPAASLGALDTALRAVTMMALETRVCGRGMAEVPLVRSTLTGVFADLLAADALCATTLRALHLLPEQAAVYAPSCGYLGTRLLLEGLEDLRVLLGTRSVLPEGRPAIVRKLARDSDAAVFGSGSRYACLAAILPQLPSLARGGRTVGWSGSAEPPKLLFDLGAELPELGPAPAPADARDAGHLLNTLIEAAGNGEAGVPAPVGRLARRLREQAARLRAECAGFGPGDLAGSPPAHAFEAASRSAVLLAAAAGRGVHRHRPDLLDETALAAVLDRLVRRLPAAGVLTQTERMEVEDHLWLELLRRVRQTRLLDLSSRRIPG